MVIFGTILIWMIKFLIRPYVPVSMYLQPVVDVAPNLIGSFLIPFGACWLFRQFFKLENLYQLRLTCLFGVFLVVVNEYLQLIPFFGRTFDYLDIVSSFVGVFIGQKVFYGLMVRLSAQ
jgi:hypothetical protein